MRDIWVVRHCEPVKGPVGMCLGRRDDPPLSSEGASRARELGEWFGSLALDNVYCSPLLRSRQTASRIGDAQVLEDLTEQDYGSWDGLDWRTIKERFSDLYAARAHDNSLVPPDAETCSEAATRYERALLATQGTCAVVAHKGALSALLCRLLDVDPKRMWALSLPYGCRIRLVEREGRLDALPSEEDTARLFQRYETPERVILHCRAVADLALEVVGDLAECGVSLSPKLVGAAAILHDVARTQKSHPACGARLLAEEGYPYLASIVAKHHSADQSTEPLDEAAIVFFADKLVCETERVNLEDRFARSRESCKTEEALRKHAALFETSQRIADALFEITGKRY